MIHSSANRTHFPKRWATFLGSTMFSTTELHLSTSLGLEFLAFRSAFSRLLLKDLSWLFLADTLPRLVWSFNEFTASPSSKVLVRVFDNSAALQMLRHLCKSRSGILSSSSRSRRSWIPQMIRSLTLRIFKITEVTGCRQQLQICNELFL